MNLKPNENRTDACDNLWVTSVKTLMEHSMEESVEHQKFVHPPDMRSNCPCQLVSLSSEKFSERMISTANLLFDPHRTILDHYNIDKMVFSHASKRLMERVRCKEGFTYILLHYVLYDEHAIMNEEWNQ